MDTARWLELGEPLAALRLGGRRGVLTLLGLALLAAWTGHQGAVFLLLGLLALAGTARLWADRALLAVEGRHELIEDRAFPGESLRLRLVAVNEKALPLAWLRVRSAIPPALTPPDAPRRWPYSERGGYLQGMSALAWYSRAAWEFELPCRSRGVYRVGPLELTSGDPFGFFTQRALLSERATVLVYPRVVPLRRLGFPLAAGLGASQRRRALQDDPSRAAGVRAYRPGDPLRRIHWKATARQGELQVRVLEPAAAPQLLLVLAADTFDFPWTRYREDLFELAVSALASIAWRALEDGWQVGLLANSPQPARLPPASSPGQLGLALEALARVEPSSRLTVAQLLAEQPASGGRAATYVLAAGRTTVALRLALERLAAARRPMVLLYGDEPPTGGARLPAYRLRQWDDLAATLEGPGEIVGSSVMSPES
jgi:uncharacterized protein (DUF58 family)